MPGSGWPSCSAGSDQGAQLPQRLVHFQALGVDGLQQLRGRSAVHHLGLVRVLRLDVVDGVLDGLGLGCGLSG